LGLATAGLAIGADVTASSADSLSCEIQADTANGMMILQGVVHADAPINGSYRFKVAGAATNISQGGAFTAAPGQAATLGKVMLGGHAIYDASLQVSANGVTIVCDKRIGGRI
ncbi:MAG: hypothetical protein GY798_28010, partial [Hyphomicrobiales bacterium]|nr:hypothetical protein [Hyphomicrobiales bacterium]